MQSAQLTTNILNCSPNSIATGQQDDYNYKDDREEHLHQVDGTTDIQTLTGNSEVDEDTEPDNNPCKQQRKIHAPAHIVRKDMTKQRQAEVLKSNKKKRKQKLKPKQTEIKLTLTNLEHISLREKHLTWIKLKVQKRVKEPP